MDSNNFADCASHISLGRRAFRIARTELMSGQFLFASLTVEPLVSISFKVSKTLSLRVFATLTNFVTYSAEIQSLRHIVPSKLTLD